MLNYQMRNRNKSVLLFFILFLISELCNAQIYTYELGISHGFSAMVSNGKSPALFLPRTTINFCYSPDLKNGIRTGLSYSNNYEASDYNIEIPVYYSFKTKKQVGKTSEEEDSYNGLISDIIRTFVPRRAEFNVGPAFGFIKRYSNYQKVMPSSNQYFSNEYVADRSLIISLDAMMRPTYVVGRVNIVLGIGISYLITRNYIYSSSNLNYRGLRPWLQLKGDVGISFSF